jgi:hypothetical protein
MKTSIICVAVFMLFMALKPAHAQGPLLQPTPGTYGHSCALRWLREHPRDRAAQVLLRNVRNTGNPAADKRHLDRLYPAESESVRQRVLADCRRRAPKGITVHRTPAWGQ